MLNGFRDFKMLWSYFDTDLPILITPLSCIETRGLKWALGEAGLQGKKSLLQVGFLPDPIWVILELWVGYFKTGCVSLVLGLSRNVWTD